MYDFTALGELLIDFTEGTPTPDGRRIFEQNAGGAPANAACVHAMHGNRAAFLGKVGADLHGDFLIKTLNDIGVDTDGIVRDPNVFTTLAFVAIGSGGERQFAFARKPGADTCLTAEELRSHILEQTRILHVGSLSMTDEPARSATLAAIRIAKDAGALISYDPNYRASLWPQESDAVTQMRALVPLADMMKLSEEEAPLLTGETDPMRALDALEQSGVTVAALTRGEKGALIRCKGQTIESPAFSVTAVDTTGAGDIFWGMFTVCLLQSGISIGRLTMRELSDFARRANAAAALSITKHGGIPSIPTAEEVDAFLSAHKTVEAFS